MKKISQKTLQVIDLLLLLQCPTNTRKRLYLTANQTEGRFFMPYRLVNISVQYRRALLVMSAQPLS